MVIFVEEISTRRVEKVGVVFGRTVVNIIVHAVVVEIVVVRSIADIADTIAIRILLSLVYIERAVVASVTDTVTITIFLAGIVVVWAVVECVFDAVAVDIVVMLRLAAGIADAVVVCILLVSVLNERAVVASVTDAVFIEVCLIRFSFAVEKQISVSIGQIGVVVVRTVVGIVFNAVTVTVDNNRFAYIAFAVAVTVFLVFVRVVRTVVAGIADTVFICIELVRFSFVVKKELAGIRIGLIRVVSVRTVVKVIFDLVSVTVKRRFFARITFRSRRIVIQLVVIGMIRAVVASVAYAVVISVFLAIVWNVRTVVHVVVNAVLVAVKSGRFASVTFRSFRIFIKLIGVGVIRAVVASVAYAVVVSVFLKWVVFIRAVILVVRFSILIFV